MVGDKPGIPVAAHAVKLGEIRGRRWDLLVEGALGLQRRSLGGGRQPLVLAPVEESRMLDEDAGCDKGRQRFGSCGSCSADNACTVLGWDTIHPRRVAIR